MAGWAVIGLPIGQITHGRYIAVEKNELRRACQWKDAGETNLASESELAQVLWVPLTLHPWSPSRFKAQ